MAHRAGHVLPCAPENGNPFPVLRRLCDKGLFQNDGGLVTVRMSREEFYARQSQQYVADSFHGSLPAFIAAFTQGRKLTEEERAEIRRMIDETEG